MKRLYIIVLWLSIISTNLNLSAQTYKADRLKKAVEMLSLTIVKDSLMPDSTIELKAKDGRTVCLRTDPMGEVEHIGIPLFNDMIRFLQPSPVYDFLEFAVLNWKYKINPNQLYLSKVIFKRGSWPVLLNEQLHECDCSIENREDKLYIVTWKREDKDVAVIGIPIDYELLNNDNRRNMERDFVKALTSSPPPSSRVLAPTVSEDDLSIYGTEGLFVISGKSYLIEMLNQNVYYQLTTIYETVDTVISNKPTAMSMEAIMPVAVYNQEFPAETFANLMMCDDASIPDALMELDIHLSNYHHEKVSIPLSHLKAFLRQHGCSLYFACDGVQKENVRGIMFACNLPKGYNHLFSLRIHKDDLTLSAPSVKADVYLYIPPIDKEKLFGTAPTKKSGANFKLK